MDTQTGGRRILLVEDEKPIAQALTKVLTRKNFTVTLVGTVKEAVSKIETESFELIILDLVLPDSHGFAVLDELRNHNQSIPVMVLSNVSHGATIDQAKMQGVCDYIVKTNISLDELVVKVVEVIEHGRCSQPFQFAVGT